MIMTQEQAILKTQDQFGHVVDFIRQVSSEGRRIDPVESDLWGRMLEINLWLLNAFVAGHRQGDLGPTLEFEGRVVRRLDQPHVRRYASVFGELAISRYVYGTRETQKHEGIPLDAI